MPPEGQGQEINFEHLAEKAKGLNPDELELLLEKTLHLAGQLQNQKKQNLLAPSLDELSDEEAEKAFFLRGFAPFAALADSQFNYVVSISELLSLDTQTPFIAQNQPTPGLFLLFEQAEGLVFGASSPIFRRSGIFGENVLLGTAQKSPFNVTPLAHCKAIYISNKDLWQFIPTMPGLFNDLCLEVQKTLEQDLVFAGKRLLFAQEEIRISKDALDELGQVSFLVDERGEIEGGISQKARSILGSENLTGRSFADILFKKDRKALQAYYRALRLLFEEEEQDYGPELALLPQETTYKGRTFHLYYTPTLDANGEVMSLYVRMEDVTRRIELKKLEESSAARQEAEDIIIKCIKDDTKGFLELIEAGDKAMHGASKLIDQVLDGNWEKDLLKDDFLNLHSIQVLCLAFGMSGLLDASNDLETAMEILWNTNEADHLEGAFMTFEAELQYANLLKDKFGDAYFSMLQGINFSAQEFNELFRFASGQDCNAVAQILMKKSCVAADLLIEGWEDDVHSLCRRVGKKVELSLEVEPGLQVWSSQIKTLNYELRHLYRNSIDHGLETPQVRAATNKALVARLIIKVRRSDDLLKITVRDDGVGIDPYKLGKMAEDNRGLDKEMVQSLIQKGEVWKLLFLPEFIGHGKKNGLAVVEDAVKKFGGKISMVSELSQGSQITIKLPLPY